MARLSFMGLQANEIASKGLARTFQTLRVFLNMTAKENVMAAAYGGTRSPSLAAMLGTPAQRREERAIQQLAAEQLESFGDRLMGYRWDQPA